MAVRNLSVTTMLLGLQRVGVIGLREAIDKVERSGISGREEIVDRLLALLAVRNYIPDNTQPEYRTALWREYLRHTGQDFRSFLTEVPVTIRGDAGEERDGFVELLGSVFIELELKPRVTYAPPDEKGGSPQLVIDDEVVARGRQSREKLRAAVHHSISGW